MPLANLPKYAVIAHRGSSAQAPENTITAFKLAISQCADAIELDVKLTADKHVVVIHDQTTDRTTGVHGWVHKLPLITIQNLDASIQFYGDYLDLRIPTLNEVFEAIDPQVIVNIELTNYATPFDDLPESVAKVVNQHYRLKSTFFSSFNPYNLYRIKRLLPDATLGLLACPGIRGSWARSSIGKICPYQSIHTEITSVRPELITKIHNWGKKIFVYTVNDESEIIRLFQLGVDGIFTDYPSLGKSIQDKFR